MLGPQLLSKATNGKKQLQVGVNDTCRYNHARVRPRVLPSSALHLQQVQSHPGQYACNRYNQPMSYERWLLLMWLSHQVTLEVGPWPTQCQQGGLGGHSRGAKHWTILAWA